MKAAMFMTASRQLTVGPMLQRSLKMLQMNSIDFAREVNEMLETNPLLEVDEGPGDPEPGEQPQGHSDDMGAEGATDAATRMLDSAVNDGIAEVGGADAWGTGSSGSHSLSDSDTSDWIASFEAKVGLRDHLRMQITDAALDDELRAACLAVVESIDERGYLDEAPDQLCQHLREADVDVSTELVERAAGFVRTLEPAGVGALDLADCLRLQLDRAERHGPEYALVRQIVTNHLELLAQGNVRTLARNTASTVGEVREAIALIKSLDPTPGRQFDNSRVDYIAPELSVRKVGGRWQAFLVDGLVPNVRINETYAAILSSHKASSADGALKKELQEARWLVRNVEQRNQTILSVGREIVARQQAYFEHGDIALIPMTLADVADAIAVHESTVSRVVASKYLICPSGMKSLKTFFTSHVHTSAGDACSATAVKAMIQRLVQAEPATEPLSDHQLAEMLQRRGVRIARRTVSKYRQALGIRSFELRRQACEDRLAA